MEFLLVQQGVNKDYFNTQHSARAKRPATALSAAMSAGLYRTQDSALSHITLYHYHSDYQARHNLVEYISLENPHKLLNSYCQRNLTH